MSYKNITIDGRVYRYKVGRSNIEIRSDPVGKKDKPYKLVVPRPAKQPRWGVIYPSVDIDADFISIFTDEALALQDYQQKKEHHPYKDRVEMVPLPAKVVAITPGWIRNLIDMASIKP
jgi:hypothetical protein